MKQIMFSTKFPAYHPRKGEPTYFVEYIWSGLADEGYLADDIDFTGTDFDFHIYYNGNPKVHTIRAGNRWKVGDEFVGKIWSGKPYRSKTITITPTLTVEKVFKIEVISENKKLIVYIDDVIKVARLDDIHRIASNDGLSYDDFFHWFVVPKNKKSFSGQIICWDNKVIY